MDQDLQQLKLLSTFYYVAAGLSALCALFPIIHLVAGITILMGGGPFAEKIPEMPPHFIGWFFIILASFFIIIGWALAINLFIAGKRLAHLSHYKYCFIVACIACIFMPFGTVLGVFTIIVLNRQSVKDLFGSKFQGLSIKELLLDSYVETIIRKSP